MERILEEIRKERGYQDGKWGHKDDDELNTPWMWTAYIASYASRWMRGTFFPLSTSTTDDFRTFMVKTAALAIAAVESLDRQREENGRAFYEDPDLT